MSGTERQTDFVVAYLRELVALQQTHNNSNATIMKELIALQERQNNLLKESLERLEKIRWWIVTSIIVFVLFVLFALPIYSY
jgi:uncharacterized membrane protein